MVAILVIGLDKIADGVFQVNKPENPGYKVEVVEKLTTDSTEGVEKIDIATLMATGDLANGKKIFKRCAACHSIAKDGGNKIGPALYNVVGNDVGSIFDYKYSKALASYGKKWTFVELNGFLTKPAAYIKGTKMTYAGLKKEEDRASVIMYLNQNNDNPKPLP